jgi:hypothetical protein
VIVSAWILLQLALYPLQVPFFRGYFSLFAAGSIFSFVYHDRLTLRRGALLAICAGLSAVNATSRPLPGDHLVQVLVTLSFFAAFLVMIRCPRLPGSRTAAMITYPLYLLHQQIGYVLARLSADPARWFVCCTVGMVAASWLVAEFVERRPRTTWISLASRLVRHDRRQPA